MSDKRMDNDSLLNESAANKKEFADSDPSTQDDVSTIEEGISEVDRVKSELQDCKEKYLRLIAEFDNFRKRTAREKLDTIQTASKDVIVSLLEVVDDAERAQQPLAGSADSDETKKGILLVFNKLKNILQSKGLKVMDAKGKEFDPDLHEAIAEVDAGKGMKGKVVDVVQNGYYLNDKIIRFAKVVVGK